VVNSRVTPDPPNPFTPLTFTLNTGSTLSRVHNNVFGPTEFNPGPNGGARFSFFGAPSVPVLYAAETDEAAVAETLLRAIPAAGGDLPRGHYEQAVMSKVVTRRDLKLASFLGTGLRALGVVATQLTDTPDTRYPQTRKWAEAAHAAGFDGIAWMSKRNNGDRAYMLFGDRVRASDLRVEPGSARILAAGPGQAWLVDLCVPLHIDVLV
jgi:hypothetical protein